MEVELQWLKSLQNDSITSLVSRSASGSTSVIHSSAIVLSLHHFLPPPSRWLRGPGGEYGERWDSREETQQQRIHYSLLRRLVIKRKRGWRRRGTMEGGEEEDEKMRGCGTGKREMEREQEKREMRQGELSHFITSGYIGWHGTWSLCISRWGV